MAEFLNHPFTWGVVVGIGIGLFGIFSVWRRHRGDIKQLRKDKERLEGALKTHMDIHSKGSEFREQELETLRRENENLRVTVQTLRQKPGREERVRLQVFEKTKDTMMQQAPGFAPAWVKTFEDIERQLEGSFVGKIPFVNRMLSSGHSSRVITHDVSAESGAN